MALQYRFFCVPVTCAEDAEAELNAFLKTVQVITLHRDLICQENRFYWAIAVEYAAGGRDKGDKGRAGRKKIDYKEVLAPEDFSTFVKLRDWRKETAAREAVPLYTIFMNEQLAAMVQKRVTTKAGLKEIEGVGDAGIEKYGNAVLAILKESFTNPEQKDETGQSPL